jgi:HEAT repeat protein
MQGIGDNRVAAVDAIRSAVYDPNRHVCRNALHTLKNVGASEALDDCAAMLSDQDSRVAQAAVEAVAALGGPQSGEPLLPCLEHSDRRVQFAALRGLGQLGYGAAGPHVLRLLESLYGKPRLEQLDYDLPCLAVRLLGDWGSPEAVPLLVRAVNEELGLRAAALDALRQIGSPEAAATLVPTLARAFRDRHADDLALMMLDLMARTDYRPSLLEVRRYLLHPNKVLRIKALQIVGAWKDVESAGLVKDLCRHDGSDFVRPAAARALAFILGPAAVPDLAGLADELNPAMRAAVRESLARIDPLPAEGAGALHKLSAFLSIGATAVLPTME